MVKPWLNHPFFDIFGYRFHDLESRKKSMTSWERCETLADGDIWQVLQKI
jgi:hypothetical protein